MTPSERARLANEILNNEVFDEAFKAQERALIAEWKASHPDKWKDREATYMKLQALLDVKQQLDNFIATAALETTAREKHGRTEGYNV